MYENKTSETTLPYVVLGGGPAGLTAGYLLARRGLPVILLEASDQVGGIARTEVRDGYRFDLGGHRFFTKAPEVEALWHELMGDDFLLRPRRSRIYWRRRFLDYPLSGMDVVRKLGPVDVARAGGSYLWAATRTRLRPRPEETFEQWVTNRFGRWLFTQFFKTYTEKLWGVSTSELRADWAAQRIRGLSFVTAAKAALLPGRGPEIRSLIEQFHYPRHGPGQLWERMRDAIEAAGGAVRLGAPVTGLELEDGRVARVVAGGEAIATRGVVSSLPLATTTAVATPSPPVTVLAAGRGLRYRDFLTVALVLADREPFPDTWIYVHEPDVRVGRIQNFRAWSPWMVPNDHETSIGMEYFCWAGDDLWSMRDDDLVALATRELGQLGLADPAKVTRGFAVRVERAYPVYDEAFAANVAAIRGWLDGIPNLVQVGRNGLHRYNNSDHSMLTAMRAVENLVDGAAHDIWAVNADSVYHETDEAPRDESPYPYRDAPPLNEREAAR